MKNCKVPITWEMIHKEILAPFCPALKNKNGEAVLKSIFPGNLFKELFHDSDDIKSLTAEVYLGTDNAKKTFISMRNIVLAVKTTVLHLISIHFRFS